MSFKNKLIKSATEGFIPVFGGTAIAIAIAVLITGSTDASTNDKLVLSDKVSSFTSSQLIPNNETSHEETCSAVSSNESSSIEESETIEEVNSTSEIKENTVTEEFLEDEFSYIPMTSELKQHIKDLCEFYDFDEKLIYQIIYHESRYDPNADNGLCQGLMQVNSHYVDHYAKVDDGFYDIPENYNVFDPYINTILGVRILDDWRRQGSQLGYTDVSDWLGFYNMGYSYQTYGSNGYPETILSTDLESIDFSNYEIIG